MRRPALAFVLAVLLASCGGGGRSTFSIPSAPDASAPHQAQSTNVNLFDATLWYGDGTALLGVPIGPGGITARIEGSYAGAGNPVSHALTVSPDSTVYDLVERNGGADWRLQIYAPGASGAAQPEQFIAGTGTALQVVLDADGIDVLSVAGEMGGRSSSATLSTFAYAAGDAPRPVRTLQLGPSVTDVAIDGNGRLYVAHSHGRGITVYARNARDVDAPVRTIASPSRSIRSVAVAADGTVYAREAGSRTVNAYAPGANGPTPSRTFALASGGTTLDGITVDAQGNVYSAFRDASGATRVDVYAPGARGDAGPMRSIPAPTQHGFITSIAIGPPAPAPPVPSSLYVGARNLVSVFAGDANGAAAPQRTITGIDRGRAVNEAVNQQRLTGIAAGSNGTLLVLETTSTGQNRTAGAIAVYGSRANGPAPPQAVYEPIGGDVPIAIARMPGVGSYDVLMGVGPNFAVDVFPDGDPQNGGFTFLLPPGSGPANGIGVDTSGNVYVSSTNPGLVYVYPPGSSGSARATRGVAPGKLAGPLTVGPDGTLYVVASDGVSPDQYVVEYAPGWTSDSTPARRLGPFSALAAPGAPVALAVNAQNELYVGLNFAGAGNPAAASDAVEVFAPRASGAAAPVRTITNPIAPNDPNGGSIVSIAVGPAPSTQAR